MKWRCECCGAVVDDPDIWHYREDMNGEGAWQDFFVQICPCCGAEEIDEMEEQDDA